MAKGKTSKSKGKKPKPKKHLRKLWEKYAVSGDRVERKNKFCPKCGTSAYLAEHKDRLTCGKCSYVEFKKKD
ncbi:30S ribosomal protein S27ae [Candidatus Woesearchaeota archaeon]|nr:MAG: 30S ribosomal protein S27ae [Candidatus Woesearchaeota archaeon]